MSVTSNAKDELIERLLTLEPESDGFRNVTQAVKVLTDADLNDRKLNFDIEKEETRKLEASNEMISRQMDSELRKIDMGIHLLDVIINPGERLLSKILGNKVKKSLYGRGFDYELGNVYSSQTFNEIRKDKYD